MRRSRPTCCCNEKREGKPFATYKYDNENRRIEKNVNGQVTRYFYDGDSINPLYETGGNGKVLRQYVYNKDGVRLAMKIQDQSVYYHYNPRGDVIAMTDKDGQIVASYEYDAWGNVLKSEAKGIAAANPFGYKEKIWINILKYTNLQQKITNIF